jgi:hypothetical protein
MNIKSYIIINLIISKVKYCKPQFKYSSSFVVPKSRVTKLSYKHNSPFLMSYQECHVDSTVCAELFTQSKPVHYNLLYNAKNFKWIFIWDKTWLHHCTYIIITCGESDNKCCCCMLHKFTHFLVADKNKFWSFQYEWSSFSIISCSFSFISTCYSNLLSSCFSLPYCMTTHFFFATLL